MMTPCQGCIHREVRIAKKLKSRELSTRSLSSRTEKKPFIKSMQRIELSRIFRSKPKSKPTIAEPWVTALFRNITLGALPMFYKNQIIWKAGPREWKERKTSCFRNYTRLIMQKHLWKES